MRLTPIYETLLKLRTGQVRSSDLSRACLDAIHDPAGEGALAFIRVYDCAKDIPANGPLAGLPISIKDLFDVEGEPTTAGSTLLRHSAPARNDAVVVQRLKSAGAVLVGKTNMTEFAFSGLGLNPHHGTPRNAFDRENARIPGGSSSGAAVSVTDGMSHAAIGSDTGGSVRVPAALCGLTGFKPTARRIPLDGVLPLSPSLDSIGPIAPTVACCELLDSVMSAESCSPAKTARISDVRVGVLQGYVLDGLEPEVAQAFQDALDVFSRSGAKVESVEFSCLDNILSANAKGGFSAPESFAWHRSLLEEYSDEYDPRVLSRIMRGRDLSAADYLDVLAARKRIIHSAESAFDGFDAIVLPTTPRVAPRISDLVASDAAYFDANIAMLRNPSVFNFLDGTALSIPCHRPGQPPVGLMIAGLAMWDKKIFGVGKALEAALTEAGCATHCAGSKALEQIHR